MTSIRLPHSTRQLLDLIWQGLGRLNLLNPKLLITLTVLLFATDVLYEGQRYPEILPRLLWVSPALIAVFVLTLMPFVWLVKRIKSESFKAVFLLFWVMVGAALKSFLFMYFLHPETYVAKFQDRVAGDLTIAGLYIVIAAVIFNAYEYHANVVFELNQASTRLAEQRETRIEVASEVEKELQDRAQSALLGELEKISQSNKAVLNSAESAALKLQIQSLIGNQVRPLSRELLAQVEVLRSKKVEEIQESRFGDLLKLGFNPRLDSSFIASYVISIPNILVTIASKVDWSASLILLVISASYPLIGWALSRLFPNRGMSWLASSILTGIVSLLAYIPTGLYLNSLSQEYPPVSITTFSAAGVLVFTALAATAWFALQRNREEKAAEILRVNAETRHEIDLLDQALWVAKRKWSYIIHGTVQGALSVASSRLEMATKFDENLKQQVHSDIERAKSVLTNPPNFARPAREMFAEIADAWRGVCDFEYQISPSAEKSLADSHTSATCLIEITKELISNASRHGKATKFWINAYLDSEGDMSLVAGNNGKPGERSYSSGLGHEMISQLTRNWSASGLNYNHFNATLPLPRNKSDKSNF